MSTALGKVCNSCGVERKKKGVLYDPYNFMPYCENPYICNDDHPNSPRNLIDRGKELKLLTFDEARERFHKYLEQNHPDREKADRIRKMVTQPTTVRIGSPELAEFILTLKDSYGLNSVSDAIRYCVEHVKISMEDYNQDYRELKQEKETEEELNVSLGNEPAPKEEPKQDIPEILPSKAKEKEEPKAKRFVVTDEGVKETEEDEELVF